MIVQLVVEFGIPLDDLLDGPPWFIPEIVRYVEFRNERRR